MAAAAAAVASMGLQVLPAVELLTSWSHKHCWPILRLQVINSLVQCPEARIGCGSKQLSVSRAQDTRFTYVSIWNRADRMNSMHELLRLCTHALVMITLACVILSQTVY